MSAPRPRPGPATENVQEAALAAEQRALAAGRAGRGGARTALRVRELARADRQTAAPVGAMTIARARAAVRRERARGAPLPGRPGVGLGREHRPARAGRRAGGDRRAHRARQQPRLPRVDGERGGARAALRPRPVAADARPRRLQAGQRHLRAPAGRRGAADGRPDPAPRSRAGSTAPARYGGEEFVVALPETGTAGRARARRADPRADRGGARSGASTAAARSRVTASIGVATLPAFGRRRAAS